MQIATTMFYDNASRRMTTLSDRANVLQTQIATGKRVQSPEEDAALAQQVAEFDRKSADTTVYQNNLTLAGAQLNQADGVMTSMTAQIQRAQELAIQASNGTQTPESRRLIGVEMASIVDALVGLANTKDLRGQPLFGTADGTKAVTFNTTTNSYTFEPTKVTDVPIGDGQMIQATESAGRMLTAKDGTNTLDMLAALAKSLDTGAAPDAATLEKLTNAGDQLSYIQASVGARSARVELQQNQLATATVDRAALRSSVEDADITSSITELQKIMTVLSATQASFSKLASLSLFDYIR